MEIVRIKISLMMPMKRKGAETRRGIALFIDLFSNAKAKASVLQYHTLFGHVIYFQISGTILLQLFA